MLVLADIVLIVHAAFVLFVVAGGLLVRRWPRVAWIHIPSALWGAGIEFAGGVCPLTPLELRLRAEPAATAPTGDFVERVLEPVLYPGWLTRDTQVLLGILVVALNAVMYWPMLARAVTRPGTHLRR